MTSKLTFTDAARDTNHDVLVADYQQYIRYLAYKCHAERFLTLIHSTN